MSRAGRRPHVHNVPTMAVIDKNKPANWPFLWVVAFVVGLAFAVAMVLLIVR